MNHKLCGVQCLLLTTCAVQDVGVDPLCQNPATRIYMTRAAQPWHVDSCDIVGEACITPTAQHTVCLHADC